MHEEGNVQIADDLESDGPLEPAVKNGSPPGDSVWRAQNKLPSNAAVLPVAPAARQLEVMMAVLL